MNAVMRLPRAALAGRNAAETECTPERIYGDPKWPMLQHAALPLTVKIPLNGIRLRDVNALAAGVTIESCWPSNNEVPLYAGDVVLSWCEFEGSDANMAVRITRLG